MSAPKPNFNASLEKRKIPGVKGVYDELLGVPTEDEQKIVLLPCCKLIIDENQPFRLYTEEQLQDLAGRIKRSGLLNPVIVRPDDKSSYEVLSGRNRVRAVMLNGNEEIRAIIREVDDDTAALIMLDANLGQREELLPSEKAKAYKMEVDIIARRGQRTDLTLNHNGSKFDARSVVGERHSESKTNISRYIRLTYLIPELLDMVDGGVLNFTHGVEISYLDEQNQKLLLDKYIAHGVKLDKAQIGELRFLMKNGELNEASMAELMEYKVPKSAKPPTVIKFNRSKFSEFADIIDNADELETLFLEFLRSRKNQQQN
jgi:ParB family chromosome partitioning protein